MKIFPTDLTDLLKRIDQVRISGKMAKEIFAEMAETGKSASQVIKEKGVIQITDEKDLNQIVEKVLKKNLENVKKISCGEGKNF